MSLPIPPALGSEKAGSRSFMLNADQGSFMVNSIQNAYMSRPEELARRMPDLRLRRAILDHRAWISVDFMGKAEDKKAKADAYRTIGKLMTALGGENCLAIYCPELQRCNEFDKSLPEKLRSDDPLALFGTPTSPPIAKVDSEDPRLIAATAEARRRWPEFVAAFEADPRKHDFFFVKMEFREGDKSEFMWVSVTDIDGDTIHGVLNNSPDRLKDVVEGQKVRVGVTGLSDWLYGSGENMMGGFTMKVMEDALKAR